MDFFATTAKHLESLLETELRGLGATHVKRVRAGVGFAGDLALAYRVCLWSRVANRVLLPLRSFPAPDPEKLYGGVKQIRWSDHLDAGRTMAVDFSASRSQITHTQYGALKVKDAIVDQLRSVSGERPSIDVKAPDVRVNVYVLEDVATVGIDLSGTSLHQRGYRDEGAPAPLKENLAAALLLLAGWPEKAAAGQSLLDPMTGSGTLPIEAALIASDTAPGLGRKHHGFLRWKGHDAAAWEKLLAEAQARRKRLPARGQRIVGYDADARAVRVALGNAKAA
jgi:23S rRNA (guanine2445-N2)-methyltransferase / 23S rRNA (guanine2069-N7)-methyltransferase